MIAVVVRESEEFETADQIYGIVFGGLDDLNQTPCVVKNELSKFDPYIGTVEVVHDLERDEDISCFQPDISKAQNLLGYNSEFSFSERIRNSEEWYLENIKLNSP